MNNTKKNKEKEEEKKRLAKALKQNILKRKKQQQSRQRTLSKLVCGEELLGESTAEYSNVFENDKITIRNLSFEGGIMPELPEVEVISNFLLDKIKNKQISNVIVNNWNLRAPITKNIDDMLKGKVIRNIKRRGKYTIWNTDGSVAVIIHLGMSGKLIYADHDQMRNKHDHVVFLFSDNTSIIFNAPRRFGLVIVLNKEQETDFFSDFGIEPLTDEFSGDYLQELLKNKKVNIKSALMDNKSIVGVGNIYASESLFRARISPLRSAKNLTYRECEKLAAEIKNTLSDAIAAGGSTLKDYAQPSGSAGYFQNNFYVYGKVQKPCKICNNIITLIRQNGRSTYFCNACQN